MSSELCFIVEVRQNKLIFRVQFEQAVEWAKQREWELLEDYCMQDTVLTHEISCHPHVKLPLSWARPVMATMEHEYCAATCRHVTLEFGCEEQ